MQEGLSAALTTNEVLNALDVAILLMDAPSRRVAFANARCAELLMRPSPDVIGRFCTELGVDADDLLRANCDALLSGQSRSEVVALPVRRPDGSTVLVTAAISAVRQGDCEPRLIAAVLREVSLSGMIEQQLATAEAMAGMVTWYWDAAGDQLLAVSQPRIDAMKLNSTFRQYLDSVHPDDRTGVEKTVMRTIKTGTGYVHEYRIVVDDGTIRWMRGVAKCLLNPDGVVTHLIGTTLDITDVKEQQATRQAPKAIQALLKDVRDNWNRPINLASLARRHGLGPRAVQRYLSSRGMLSLSKYVKQLRLQHAHQALADPAPSASVTAIALSCGFQNPGQFSREYRAEFGELPSDTLRRALASRVTQQAQVARSQG